MERPVKKARRGYLRRRQETVLTNTNEATVWDTNGVARPATPVAG
ncbi:MAG: hypothetical protein ABSF64_23440 [Bryobacteraceae bacterium]